MSSYAPVSADIEPDLEAQRPAAAQTAASAQGIGNIAQPQQGELSILQQSSHPLALICLFAFRSLAVTVYLLCGFFSNSFVFSTVLVVLLLSADFWTVRNVSGRVLVGLRYWNQVDEDGTSYWVFESRDPSQPANAVDAKMFWIALYSFPAIWVALLIVCFLKFNLSHPRTRLQRDERTFSYADRDAKRRWATGMATSGVLGSFGGLGGSMAAGLAKSAAGKLFG